MSGQGLFCSCRSRHRRTHATASQLGDARSGKLADNLTGFGRPYARRCADRCRPHGAGTASPVAGGLARQAWPPRWRAVLISREQDRQVFRELFAVYFQPRCGAEAAGADAAHRPRKIKGAPAASAWPMRWRRCVRHGSSTPARKSKDRIRRRHDGRRPATPAPGRFQPALCR